MCPCSLSIEAKRVQVRPIKVKQVGTSRVAWDTGGHGPNRWMEIKIRRFSTAIVVTYSFDARSVDIRVYRAIEGLVFKPCGTRGLCGLSSGTTIRVPANIAGPVLLGQFRGVACAFT